MNTRRPVAALANTTGWKTVERMIFGSHCKAYEFEHQADANLSG
jgi:hypothetical protein